MRNNKLNKFPSEEVILDFLKKNFDNLYEFKLREREAFFPEDKINISIERDKFLVKKAILFGFDKGKRLK